MRDINLERALKIFSSMLLESNLNKKDFDNEKGIVQEELKRIIDNSEYYILDLLHHLYNRRGPRSWNRLACGA